MSRSRATLSRDGGAREPWEPWIDDGLTPLARAVFAEISAMGYAVDGDVREVEDVGARLTVLVTRPGGEEHVAYFEAPVAEGPWLFRSATRPGWEPGTGQTWWVSLASFMTALEEAAEATPIE